MLSALENLCLGTIDRTSAILRLEGALTQAPLLFWRTLIILIATDSDNFYKLFEMLSFYHVFDMLSI